MCGSNGKMSHEIILYIHEKYQDIKVDEFDILDSFLDINFKEYDLIIDFSSKEISLKVIREAINNEVAIISGTTGFSEKEINDLKELAITKNTMFYWSPNFSKGYKLLDDISLNYKDLFTDISIVEKHSALKKDKPSGTAKVLASNFKVDINEIVSYRLDNVLAIHEVTLKNEFESIKIIHNISNRKALLDGFKGVLKDYLENR